MTKNLSLFDYHRATDKNFQLLAQQIKEADFLISDEKCTHRLVGLKYNEKMVSTQSSWAGLR